MRTEHAALEPWRERASELPSGSIGSRAAWPWWYGQQYPLDPGRAPMLAKLRGTASVWPRLPVLRMQVDARPSYLSGGRVSHAQPVLDRLRGRRGMRLTGGNVGRLLQHQEDWYGRACGGNPCRAPAQDDDRYGALIHDRAALNRPCYSYICRSTILSS
jgi:hypothetical protein